MIVGLDPDQLTDYFSERLAPHSWSTIKLDLYGLRFYYEHVLVKPWLALGLVKLPKSQRLSGIVTVAEMQRLIRDTRGLLGGKANLPIVVAVAYQGRFSWKVFKK